MEYLEKVDFTLFKIINGLSGRWQTLDSFSSIAASDYLIPMMIGLILTYLWFGNANPLERERRQWATMAALIHMTIASFTVLVINQYAYRFRPFDILDHNLLFYMPTDSSFPSNAAVGTLAVSIPFFFEKKIGWGTILFILSVTISFSRIFVGVHYPGDIIGGYLLVLLLIPVSTNIVRISKPVQKFLLRLVKGFGMA